MLSYADNLNKAKSQQDIFEKIKKLIANKDYSALAELLDKLNYGESLFEYLLPYANALTNDHHLQLFIIALAAKTNTNKELIEYFLKQTQNIIWLMEILSISKSGCKILSNLMKYKRFCKLLESIVTNLYLFPELIHNAFSQENFRFVEMLIELLETACTTHTNDSFLLYKAVLCCQALMNTNQNKNFNNVDKNYTRILENCLCRLIGHNTYEALQLLNQENYKSALIAIKSLSTPQHIIAMISLDVIPKVDENLKTKYFEQALRLCNGNQINDHLEILINFANHLLNNKENVSDIIEKIFALAAQARDTPERLIIILSEFIQNCHEKRIGLYLLTCLFGARTFLKFSSNEPNILFRKPSLIIHNNLLALLSQKTFDLTAVTYCMDNDLIEIIKKIKLSNVQVVSQSIDNLILIPLTDIFNILKDQTKYDDATVIAGSIVVALKQLPIDSHSASFSMLLKWLELQYQCLVRHAQVNALQRSELLAKARAVKYQISRYADFILEKRLQEESLIGQPENIIKDIDLAIKSNHRDPVMAIFSLLYQFIRVDFGTLSDNLSAFTKNMQELHSLCRTFFDDDSYRPELKVKLFNQWIQLLKSLLIKFLSHSEEFLDLILDIKQLILDLQIYKDESLSLRYSGRFLLPSKIDKSVVLNSATEYFVQRNAPLIPENLLSLEAIQEQTEQQKIEKNSVIKLLEKVNKVALQLETQSSDVSEISIKINQLLISLKEMLISKIIHLADSDVKLVTDTAARLSEYNLQKEAMALINALWQLSFNFNFDVINDALMVWRRYLSLKINDSAQLHDVLLFIRKIRTTGYLLFYSKSKKELEQVLPTGKYLMLHGCCNSLARSFDGINIPYLSELYDALAELYTAPNDKVSSIIVNITSLLFKLAPDKILTKDIIKDALNHTCQLLDIFLLHLIGKTLENEAFDLKLKLLDLLINLYIKIKYFNNEKVNEDDIETFLYSLQSWRSPLTKSYYEELIATKQKLAELEKLELDSHKSTQKLSLISLLEDLHRYYSRFFDYHHVAEITITLRNIFVINASETGSVCDVLCNLIHQFYYESPLATAEKLKYLQRFEWLITNLFNLIINDTKIDCDVILSLDTLLLDIKRYQEKIETSMALEASAHIINNTNLCMPSMQM